MKDGRTDGRKEGGRVLILMYPITHTIRILSQTLLSSGSSQSKKDSRKRRRNIKKIHIEIEQKETKFIN